MVDTEPPPGGDVDDDEDEEEVEEGRGGVQPHTHIPLVLLAQEHKQPGERHR